MKVSPKETSTKFFDKIYNLPHSKELSKELSTPHIADQPVQDV